MTFALGFVLGAAVTSVATYATGKWAVRELIRRGRLQGSIDGKVFR